MQECSGAFRIDFGRALAQNMTSWPLHCQTRDDEIVVTLPGTTYTVTYYKLDGFPQLLARLISDKDDKRLALTRSEFSVRLGRLPITRRASWGGLAR